MKVCINYFGQPRKLEVMNITYDTFLKDDKNDIHILWTTWKSENINEFMTIFPNAYINQIDEPNMDNYSHITTKYRMDPGSPNKTIDHYIKGLYVKYKSSDTISNYEYNNNINFDIIITTRIDTYINSSGKFNKYYDDIINKNSVFVGSGPKFNVYNNGAYPDVISIAKPDIMKKSLNQISIIDKCNVNNTNWFHPETSFYKSFIAQNINVVELDFLAFPQLWGVNLLNNGPYKYNGQYY
jgi:hypothetical protein